MSNTTPTREFPEGCTINNIRRGKGARSKYIYADLVGPDGTTLICASLEYIEKEMRNATIGGVKK